MDTLLPTLPAISSLSTRTVRDWLRLRHVAIAASAASALMLCALQPALATNGVVDINQARALAGGITAGDTPGFPITISESGSYRLTSNIDIRGVAAPLFTSAISITAPDVSLDLNGFSVIGPVNCTGAGATISCLPAPGGSGATLIVAVAGLAPRFSLRNGSVRGAGDNGASLDGADTSVRDVVFSSNFNHGLRMNNGGTVHAVQAIMNNFRGITLGGTNTTLSLIRVKENGADGVSCSSSTGTRLYQVNATNNGGFGASNCTVESSHFYFNNGAAANPQLSNSIDVGNNVCYRSTVLTACP